MTEFGIVVEPSPGYTAKLAVEIEAMGFDVMLCPDTQNLCGDVYGQLNLAAAGTKRLHLGTGRNPPGHPRPGRNGRRPGEPAGRVVGPDAMWHWAR